MAEDEEIQELIDWIDSALPQVQILSDNCSENKKIVDQIQGEISPLEAKVAKQEEVSENYPSKLQHQDEEFARNLALLPNAGSRPEFDDKAFAFNKTKHQTLVDAITKAKKKVKKLSDEAEEIDAQIAPLHKELKDPINGIKAAVKQAGQDYDALQDVVDLVQDIFSKMEELSAMWQDRADLNDEYRIALNKVALAYQDEIDFDRSERDRRDVVIKALITALKDVFVTPAQATGKPPMSPKDSTMSVVSPVDGYSDDEEGNEEDLKALREWIAHADTQMKVFDDQIAAERPAVAESEPKLLTMQAVLQASKQIDTQVEHGLNHQDQQFQAWFTQAQEKGISDHSDFNHDKFAIHASYTDKLDHIDDQEMAMNKAAKVVKKAKALVEEKGPAIKNLETEISKERAAGDIDSLETAVELIQKLFEMKGDMANALKQLHESYEKQVAIGHDLNTLRQQLTDMKNREKRRRERFLKKIELRLTNAGVTPTKVPEKPVPVDEPSEPEADPPKDDASTNPDAKTASSDATAPTKTADADPATAGHEKLSDQAATEYLDEDQKAFLEWIEDANKQLADVMKELEQVTNKYKGFLADATKASEESDKLIASAKEAEAKVTAQDAAYEEAIKEIDESRIPDGCKKEDWALQQQDDINEYKANMEAAVTEHEGDKAAHAAKMAEATKVETDLKPTEDKIKAQTGKTDLDTLENQTVLIGEQFEKRQTQVDLANVAKDIAESAVASASHPGEVATALRDVFVSEEKRRANILTKVKAAGDTVALTAEAAKKYTVTTQVLESSCASFAAACTAFKENVKKVENELIAITSAKMALDAQEDNYVPTGVSGTTEGEWKVAEFGEEVEAKSGEAKLSELRSKMSETEKQGTTIESTGHDAQRKANAESDLATLEAAIKEMSDAITALEKATTDIEGCSKQVLDLHALYARKTTHLNAEAKRREGIMSAAPAKENVAPSTAAQNAGDSSAKKLLKSDSLAALLADSDDGGDRGGADEDDKVSDTAPTPARPTPKPEASRAAVASEPEPAPPRVDVPGALHTEDTTTAAQRKATAKRVRRQDSLRALLESEAEDSSSHVAPSEMQHSVASGELLSMGDLESGTDREDPGKDRPTGWMVLPDEDLPDLPPELQEGDNTIISDRRPGRDRSDLPVYLQNMLGSTNLKEDLRDPQPWAQSRHRGRRDPFKLFIFPETARSRDSSGQSSWGGQPSHRRRPASAHVSSDRFQGARKLRPASARPRLGSAAAPERPDTVRASRPSKAAARRPQSARPASARLGAPTKKLRPQSAKGRVPAGPSPYEENVRVSAVHQPHPPRRGSAKNGSLRSKRGLQNNKPPWDNMVGSGPNGIHKAGEDAPIRAAKPSRPSSVRSSRPKSATTKSASGLHRSSTLSQSQPTRKADAGHDAVVSRPPTGKVASKSLTTQFHEGMRKLMSVWGLLGYPRDRRLRFVQVHGQVTQENYKLIQTEIDTFMKFRELVLDILELIDNRERLFAQIKRDLLDKKDTATNEQFTQTVLTFLEVTENVTDAIEHLKDSASWITSFNYHGQDYEKKILADAEYLKRSRSQKPTPSPIKTDQHRVGLVDPDGFVSHSPTGQGTNNPFIDSDHGRSEAYRNGHNVLDSGYHEPTPNAPWHSSGQSKQHEQRVESLLREQMLSDIESPKRYEPAPGETAMFQNVWGNGTYSSSNGVYISEDPDDSSDSDENPLLQEVHTPRDHGTPVRNVGTQESGTPKFLRASPGGWTERAARRMSWSPEQNATATDADAHTFLSPEPEPSPAIRRTNSVHWFDEDEEEPELPHPMRRSGSILRIHTQASESELVDAKEISQEGEKIKKEIQEKKAATAELERERQRFEEERLALAREREEMERLRAQLATQQPGAPPSAKGGPVPPPEDTREPEDAHLVEDPVIDSSQTARGEPATSDHTTDTPLLDHDEQEEEYTPMAVADSPPSTNQRDALDHGDDGSDGNDDGDDDNDSMGSMNSTDLDISWHSSEEDAMDAALERLMSSKDLMADFDLDGADGDGNEDVALPDVTDENIERNMEEV